MRDNNTGNMCGYNTNHSEKICAGMTAIRSITRKFLILNFSNSTKGHFSGNEFYNTNHSKNWVFYIFMAKNCDFGQIFGFLQKVIFVDLEFITAITRKFMK